MGFLNRLFGKSSNEDKKEEPQNPRPAMDDVNVNLPMNFMNLNRLVHSSVKEIKVDRDVVLQFDEQAVFVEGIPVDVDGIIIDGNNHKITSNSKSRIFNVTARNVVIKNFIFEKGYSPELGGAIFVQEGASCIVESCKFNGCIAYTGAAILNTGELAIRNSSFNDNGSEYAGGAVTNMARLNVEGSSFSSNKSTGGGAIYNHYDAFLKVFDSKFYRNSANQGGAIISLSKIEVRGTSFSSNSAVYGGGAINSSDKCSLSITECKFMDNEAMDGGAIVNVSEVDMSNIEFEGNYSKIGGGAINNVGNAKMSISSCDFIKNRSDTYGGAIINMGDMNLNDSKFANNISSKDGGALNLQGTTKISKIQCIENHAQSGGALTNHGKTVLEDSQFAGNMGGSAVGIYGTSLLEMSNVEFCNHSRIDAVIYNDSEIKLMNCSFIENKPDTNLILNNNSMILIDSILEKNSSKSIILNNENSKAEFNGGELKDNLSDFSTICNFGECIISKAIFKNNISDLLNYGDVYNKSDLYLHDPKFKDSKITVFNKGYIDASRVSCNDLMAHIENEGTVDCVPDITPDRFNFSHLDDLIHKSGEKSIVLKDDVCMEGWEMEFYEGGIDLDIDGMVIDGNGRVIDGNDKSRIFNITGKDITLRNIIFKNGHQANNYEENSTGGGAIKVSKGACLKIENCEFSDNSSQAKGGVILNNGELFLESSKFITNKSKTYGGAISNHDSLRSVNCLFKNNESEVGGAILNNGELVMNDSQFEDNRSNFDEPVFNIGSIHCNGNSDGLIYNVGDINRKSTNVQTFNYLYNQIRQNDEITLTEDIRFDYKEDSALKSGIEIDKNLTVKGNGHSIDANHAASLFDITDGDAEVVFEDVTFKNAHSLDQSIIENRASVVFRNCRFINNRAAGGNSLINNENSLKIIKSIFSGNLANNTSINNIKETEIADSIFIINCSKSSGSIITNDNPVINEDLKGTCRILISESTFNSNPTRPISNGGWAIANIESTRFLNNRDDVEGGAVHNSGELNINQCTFENNLSKYAGAILSSRFASLNVSKTRFMRNSSQGGGAIVNFGEFTLSHSLFENNNSKLSGGAIFTQHAGTLKVMSCDFIRNSTLGGGGAIFINEGADKFKGNSSIEGVHLADYTKVVIDGTIFADNSSKNDGGAINNQKDILLVVSSSEFNGNESDNFGGAISSFGILKLMSSKFSNNKAGKDAGAVVSSSEFLNDDCEFIDNLPNDFKMAR